MSRIVLQYSEDFRENMISSEFYETLIELGLEPIMIHQSYVKKFGLARVSYSFREGVELPPKSELEEKASQIRSGIKVIVNPRKTGRAA